MFSVYALFHFEEISCSYFLEVFFSFLLHEWVLNFVKCFFCIYLDNHKGFIL